MVNRKILNYILYGAIYFSGDLYIIQLEKNIRMIKSAEILRDSVTGDLVYSVSLARSEVN